MGYVEETRNKEELISEQDLLNIGLSRHYVTSIVARIKEYKDKKNKKKKENN